MILHALVLAAMAPAAATAVYYAALAGVAVVHRRRGARKDTQSPPEMRFAIVIPAHDEESTLAPTLESCAALEYPKPLHDVWVVADNCSDDTSGVARRHGARCLERHDAERRGKGFALEWAFDSVLQEAYDAVVVLDADCRLDPASLRCFDSLLRQGHLVIQATDVVSNPDDSPVSYILAVGNYIENDLFYAPKSLLGLAVFLRGTGMVFHRQVLQRVPWRARSVAEDVEYGLQLLEAGIPVAFEPRVSVSSRFPTGRAQVDPQRERWAAGSLSLSRTRALPLLWQGLHKRKLLLVDAGWTLLVLSRPLVLLQLGLGLGLSVLNAVLDPGGLSRALLVGSLGVLLLQGVYFSSGVLSMGLNRKRLALLLQSPWALGRLAFISLGALMQPARQAWVKTPRS